MLKSAIGVFIMLVGLMMLIFMVMAYRELHSAATSVTPPSVDSMPFSKIVNPELFAPGNAGTKPATLAQRAFNRIYMVGGGSFVLVIIGIIILAIPQSREKEKDES